MSPLGPFREASLLRNGASLSGNSALESSMNTALSLKVGGETSEVLGTLHGLKDFVVQATTL